MRTQLAKITLTATLGLALTFTLSNCSSDWNGDGGGGLSGKTYELESTFTSSGTYASKVTNTYTYEFTSREAGKYTYTQKGWQDGLSSNGGKRKNIDETQKSDFTYTYTDEADKADVSGVGKKVGVMTRNGSQRAFAISDDGRKLCLDSTNGNCSNPYTLK